MTEARTYPPEVRKRAGLTTDKRQRLKELERAGRELKQASPSTAGSETSASTSTGS